MTALALELEDGGRTVFELLEDPPAVKRNKSESSRDAELRSLGDALGGCGLATPLVQRLLSESVHGFMTSEPKAGESVRIFL
jgi:hypothetical protein